MKIYADGKDLMPDIPDMPEELFYERLERIFSSELLKKGSIPECVRETEVSVTFVEPEKMADINSRYRQINAPTDVLSFPLWEENAAFNPPWNWEKLPLGDILVCPDTVASNAKENNRTFAEELVLVLSHGLLHLIGYDHDNAERESDMWAEQDLMVRMFFAGDDPADGK